MKETAMLFVPAMVRANKDGSKTQTRRIVKDAGMYAIDAHIHGDEVAKRELERLATRCPYGQPGDLIWVRETARLIGKRDDGKVLIYYEADGELATVDWPDRLKPLEVGKCIPNGCHREAARIWLEITRVRVERLQDISEADAKAEGADCLIFDNCTDQERAFYDFPLMENGNPYRNGYALLWLSLAGAGSWAANPWVWVIEFKRVEQQKTFDIPHFLRKGTD